MPYSRLSNVANFNDVLSAIRNFLVAAGGWTLNQDLAAPDEGVASGGVQLVATNGTTLVGLRSTTTGVGANRLYLFDGIPPYTGTPNLDSLPGNSGIRYTDAIINSANQPAQRHLQTASGPFPTVDLFSNNPSTYCHAVVQIAAGRYRHLLFGSMEKFGTWTGGSYYACTRWSQSNADIDVPFSTAHTIPFDGSTGGSNEAAWTAYYVNGADTWLQPGADVVVNSVQRRQALGGARSAFLGQAFFNKAETPFSGLIALQPLVIGALRLSDTPDTIHVMGRIPDVRRVNITNLVPGNTYPIGSDNWIIFPAVRKHSIAQLSDDQENSAIFGYAYLQRT